MSTMDLSCAAWHKSSYSNQNGGNCVEVAANLVAASGVVPVRDSKDPQGPALTFRPAAWTAFIAAVDAGAFGEI